MDPYMTWRRHSLYYADAYYKAMGEKGRRAARAAHAEEERVGLQAAMRLVLLIARSFQVRTVSVPRPSPLPRVPS